MDTRDMLWRAMLADPFEETLRMAWGEYLQEHEPDHTAKWLAACPFVPKRLRPSAAQARFLDSQAVRAGFVGASGGTGKTTTLLLDALRYVEYPGYHALILAHDRAAIEGVNGLSQRLSLWCHPLASQYRDVGWFRNGAGFGFRFPSGATIDIRVASKNVCATGQFSYVGIDNAELVTPNVLNTVTRDLKPPSHPQVPFRLRLTGAHQLHFPKGTAVIGAGAESPHAATASTV